jgi:acyl-CoA dehydrogenase
MVPNSLGPGILLMQYGTEEQKKYYLPRLASGVEIPCFALTAPEAGSDAGGMNDFGIVCRGEFEGNQDVLGIRLTWNKRYITLGPVATLLGLAFKLYDPDHLLGEQEEIGITLALIPTTHPGVNIGRRHLPANIPFQNGPNSGKDVFIPMDWIIGGRDRIGQGWRMLMECLSDGRGISLPALSTGAGKLASRTTGAYARIRRQFNIPIGRFEGIQEVLARIAGLTYMMDAARILTLTAIDQGEKPAVITAIVKYHLTEAMRQLVNDAVDVHGGKAIMLGPRNYLASIYQSIPISITVEGANILTRNMIIFGQGAIRCHPYVLSEMKAVAEVDEKIALKQFDKAIFGHTGFIISNVVRTFLLGLSGGRLHRSPTNDVTAKYYQQVMRMSAAFALLADVSMIILGGSLKRRESLSARLGDILSNLYLVSAVLKHYQDQDTPSADKVLFEWGCQYGFYNLQKAIDEFLANFPQRVVAKGLQLLIFPLGRSYSKPSDKLNAVVAELILAPSETRDRLTEGIFIPQNSDQPVYQLERALISIIAAEPSIDNITTAMRKGILKSKTLMDAVDEAINSKQINENEAKIIRDAIQLRDEVIAVDDFSTHEISDKEAIWQSQKQVAQST